MTLTSDEAPFTWVEARVHRLFGASARHPLLTDLAWALATAAISAYGLASQHRLGLQTAVFCGLLSSLLALRHRGRVLCFASIALVAFVQWLVSAPQLADVAVLIALYWVARDAGARWVAGATLIVEAGAVMAAERWSPSEPLKIWVGLSGLMVAASVLGITVRQRRALLVSLQEKAARLEVERDRESRLGAAAERARIAREMHDIVSHNLTVMIALSDGAAYALESDPEQAMSAMQRASATGRQALLEMRRLLGVLRDEPSPQPLEPQPSLARLDDLLGRVHAAGIPVSLSVEGDPGSLSEGVQLAVFRVAQEALTNTLKHAVAPTRAELHLRCRGGQVDLEVSDDGRVLESVREGARLPAGGRPELGRGLRGMRERAAVYGGELQAGPGDDGGWRVHLRLDSDSAAPVT